MDFQKDDQYIRFNKLATAVFFDFFVRYAFVEPNIVWGKITVVSKVFDRRGLSFRGAFNHSFNSFNIYSSQSWQVNFILPIPCVFLLYDFFYLILHWGLHIKGIYEYIHKHHHRQKAPRFVFHFSIVCARFNAKKQSLMVSSQTVLFYFCSRANVDAMNVHPLEFFFGEYNHIWALYVYCRILNCQMHVVALPIMLAISGVLAGLNHTRYDVTFTVLGLKIYDSKAHDVHHRIPQSNYAQFTMFFDYLFGSYR